MSGLTPELEKKLGMAVERMPAFPGAVQKILQLTRNINCKPKDLVEVIEKDPVMTMKILKVINSAFYSLPAKVTSVSQSVVYLGINTVKNLALAFAAVGILPKSNAAEFDIQKYLLHSLVVAGVSRQLANQLDLDNLDPGDCYIAGLLHDFGKVVFVQFLAGDFRSAIMHAEEFKVPLHEAERKLIGVDHGVAGAMLAKRWQFPDHLVQCISDHHNYDAKPTPMMDCVRVADQLVRLREVGYSGNPWHEGEVMAAPGRFGDDLVALGEKITNFDKIVEEAVRFAQVGSGG